MRSTPCILAQQVTRTVVASNRITSGSPPLPPHHAACGDFQRTVRRVVPVFRASPAWFSPSASPPHHASRTVIFSPRSPPYITAVTAFSALYPACPAAAAGSVCSVTRSRTSYCRNRPFPVLVRIERGQPPVSVVLIRRPATRRIRLPAHPPWPSRCQRVMPAGWCISPTVRRIRLVTLPRRSRTPIYSVRCPLRP